MSGFQFKQFSIEQQDCAMKVGTDGVLLGSWADITGCNRILDVGTGTGLIALMLRQRSLNVSIEIQGIELDPIAVKQAKNNVNHSPWCDVTIFNGDFNGYQAIQKFDLVVSNPPYFVNSLKCENHSRNQARHTDSLSFSGLIEGFIRVSTDNGRLAMILPTQSLEHIKLLVERYQLYITKLTLVHTKAEKSAKRMLVELSKSKFDLIETRLTIHEGLNYSADFVELTKDFYLKMPD